MQFDPNEGWYIWKYAPEYNMYQTFIAMGHIKPVKGNLLLNATLSISSWGNVSAPFN